jgi:hypothetical protein
MCGRFSQFKEFREVRLRFDWDALGADWDESVFLQPRYNITPSQKKGTGYFSVSTSPSSRRPSMTSRIFAIQRSHRKILANFEAVLEQFRASQLFFVGNCSE